MSSQNPMDQFLNKLAEFLQLANLERQKKPEGKLDKAIEERLRELENSTQLLKQLTEETLKQAGIQEEQITSAMSEEAKTQLPNKERQLLERTAKLQQEANIIAQEISKEAVIAKQKQKFVGKKGKSVQTRKKRFRPMGGHKDWKPL